MIGDAVAVQHLDPGLAERDDAEIISHCEWLRAALSC